MNRPVLHERALEQALEALRTGQALRDHVLYSFLCVQARLREPYTLTGPAALQVAVFDLLTEIIFDRLAHLRTVAALPAPDPTGADPQIARDFASSNQELEAWSVLYARYVCVDSALSMTDLVDITGMPERTLRRRLERGIRRLTYHLIRLEQTARRQERRIRLRLALPQSQPPALVGVDVLLPTVVHLAQDIEPPCHVLLHGSPGVGKTVLALAAAHILVDRCPLDDVLWLSLAGRSASAEVIIDEIVVRLGLAVSSDSVPVQALRAYLLLHAVLIILDGADGLIAECEPVLTALDRARVLITSRTEPPSGVWCSQVPIPELTRDNAFQLLASAVPTPRQRDHLDEQFDAVWPVVGGNPLALKLALGLIRHVPSAALHSAHPLGDILDAIWNSLPAAERQLWVLSCLFHPAGLPFDLCSKLLDLPLERITAALAALSRMALLEVQSEAPDVMVYHLSPMATSYVSGIVRADAALGDGVSCRQFASAVFRRWAQVLTARPDPFLALQSIQAASRIALPVSERWLIMSTLAPQITAARLWQPWVGELRALTVDGQSEAQQFWREHALGTALRWTGCFAEASTIFETLLARTRLPGPHQAAALIELSVVRRYQGAWEEAYRLVQSAFDVMLHSEDDQGIVRCVHELAQISVDVQDPARALAWLSRLDEWDARAWGAASQAYTILGQHEDAITAAHRALDLLPQQHPDRGRGMVGVANAYVAHNQFPPAVDYLTAALDQLDRSRDIIGYARGANNLAAVLLHQPVHERVLSNSRLQRLLAQALEVQQQSGDELGVRITQHNVALLAAEC